jgi:pyruvate dehydrogenase E2 component (dihydrolipoamide acetyltransferase)
MAELLRMPEVAAAATEAVLSAWPLSEGAAFDKGDAIVIVETDKAEVEIPASAAGVLIKTLVAAGAEVEVGNPIALLGAPGEQVPDIDALLASLGVAPATPSEAKIAVRRDVPDVPAAAAPVPAAAVPVPAEALPAPAPADDRRGRIFTSPLARKLAREAGLAMETLNGTGPGGRIVRKDVDVAIAAARTAEPVRQTTAEALPPTASVPAVTRQDTRQVAYEDIPHTRMRRAIAARLLESKQSAPHFYIRASCRAEALLDLREQINTADAVKISVNDMLIKAMARAHVLVPEMNAIWTPDAVRRFSGVDISVAIATDKGLVTPVLRGVEALSLSAIAAQVRGYAEQARSGGLKAEDLEGGSITITNLGMFGVEEFAAIINPPQSAILAVGAARYEPVVIDGALEAARVLKITLSVDHRPIDGALAAKWIAALTAVIESPLQILV